MLVTSQDLSVCCMEVGRSCTVGVFFFVVVVVQKTLPAMSGNEVKSKATAET